MVDSSSIKLQITSGQLQRTFTTIAENIKKKNLFDSSSLPIEYSDLFSFYLFLTKSLTDYEAFNKILEYLEWRERLGEIMSSGSSSSLDHLLGCNVNTIFKRMPECHFGYDKNRRPVVYYLFGMQDIPETLKIINRKQIFDYHLWQNDAINELCYHKTLESGSMISSSTLVMDVAGMTSANVSPDFLHILNRRAEVNGRYFPYLFDRILIINAISTDAKMIRTLKDFCSTYSPRANVYVTGPERNPSDVLSKYIDIDQLPTEYGGLKGSIMAVSHPFYDAITFRRIGGGVLPYRKGVGYSINSNGPSTPLQDKRPEKRASYTATTTIGTSPYDMEDDEIGPSQFSTVASVGNTNDHIDESSSMRTFSVASSRYHLSRYANRSISLASSNHFLHGNGAGNSSANGNPPYRTEYLLSNVSMNPYARYALILFLELFLGTSLPYPSISLMIDYGLSSSSNPQLDCVVSNASTSPISSNAGKSIDTIHTYQSSTGLTNNPNTAVNPNMKSTQQTNPNRTYFQTSTQQPIVSLSMSIKPGVFSLCVDGILQTSVGRGLGSGTDMFCLRTRNGVISFKATIPPSVNIPSNQIESSIYTTKKVGYKKYQGNLVLSNGRIYCLTRGASMSGWLQKWPMKSQSAGGYTHRYFILEDNELRYWKVDPNSGRGLPGNRASMSSVSTPQSPPPDMHPKGGITLTPNTIIKRSKTLFGSSIIDIKSEYDAITLCAYNSADDSAWFSELYHALERVKKVYRDENSNEQPFPEIVWRQQDPLCVAVDVDVIDTSSCEDYYRYRTSMISPPLTITPDSYRKNVQQNLSIHSTDSPTYVVDNNINYVVLCRVNTGLSSLHSVQIGSYEHIPLRLENNDLDIGVKLLSVKLCGDCLIVSGSNGFVGSGRIAQFSDSPLPTSPTLNSPGGIIPETKRIYIRRFMNNFHGDDSVVQCLATPRYHVHDGGNEASVRGNGPYNFLETSVSILASGDDIGGLCIWRRDKGTNGPAYSIPQKNGGNSTVRYGYTWTCIHHAKVGHRITSLSFSADGTYLAATTIERAILFDLSSLLSVGPTEFVAAHQISQPLPLNTRGSLSFQPTHITPMKEIRTCMLDDSVGINSELIFSVDLSTSGFVKLWKIKQGTDSSLNRNSHHSQHSHEETESSTSSDRAGIASDRLYYTEMPISQVFTRTEPCFPLHKLFVQKDSLQGSSSSTPANVTPNPDPNIRFTIGQSSSEVHTTVVPNPSQTNDAPSIYRVDSFGNKVPTTFNSEQGSHHEGSTLSEANGAPIIDPLVENTQMTQTISTLTKPKQKETGWMVDPFSYADVCVIDPLRMHLRDWWCDYSSRFLLLGHGRIASLTNFEPISLSSQSSLSKSNPLRDDTAASPLSTSSLPSTLPSIGLDKKSTSMFWSTLTSSLGRRVIARYYVPMIYYEKKKAGQDIKSDCLKFILYITRCLYETLGDEYLNSLLIAWKAIAQDEIRNILEKYSSTWFKDITTVNLEVLRRMELSPNIAMSCIDDIIQFITKVLLVTSQEEKEREENIAGGSSSIPTSTSTPLSAAGSSPPLIELQNVLNMLTTLKNSFSIISDESGILHLVPSYILRYLEAGILPLQLDNMKLRSPRSDPNNYGMPVQQWEDEEPTQLLYSLVVEPLSYLERTEPFAVALTIVGLQGVPVYIYNNIMGRGESGPGSTATGGADTNITDGAGSGEKTSAEKLLISLQKEKQMKGHHVEPSEKGIEGLISIMAKVMPPWIRFILTSDTDKVLA